MNARSSLLTDQQIIQNEIEAKKPILALLPFPKSYTTAKFKNKHLANFISPSLSPAY